MGFYTRRASIQGPTEYESDALPTEPLGLFLNELIERRKVSTCSRRLERVRKEVKHHKLRQSIRKMQQRIREMHEKLEEMVMERSNLKSEIRELSHQIREHESDMSEEEDEGFGDI